MKSKYLPTILRILLCSIFLFSSNVNAYCLLIKDSNTNAIIVSKGECFEGNENCVNYNFNFSVCNNTPKTQ